MSDKRVLLSLLLNSQSSHQPMSCSSCLPCTITSKARPSATAPPLPLPSVMVSLITHTAANGTSCHPLQCSSACRSRALEYATNACATSHAIGSVRSRPKYTMSSTARLDSLTGERPVAYSIGSPLNSSTSAPVDALRVRHERLGKPDTSKAPIAVKHDEAFVRTIPERESLSSWHVGDRARRAATVGSKRCPPMSSSRQRSLGTASANHRSEPVGTVMAQYFKCNICKRQAAARCSSVDFTTRAARESSSSATKRLASTGTLESSTTSTLCRCVCLRCSTHKDGELHPNIRGPRASASHTGALATVQVHPIARAVSTLATASEAWVRDAFQNIASTRSALPNTSTAKRVSCTSEGWWRGLLGWARRAGSHEGQVGRDPMGMITRTCGGHTNDMRWGCTGHRKRNQRFVD